MELNRRRTSNGFAPLPIPMTEIIAWATYCKGIALEQWEAQALYDLDGVFLRVMAEKAAEKSKPGEEKTNAPDASTGTGEIGRGH